MSVITKLSLRTIESFVSPGSIPELGIKAANGPFTSTSFQFLVSLFGGILRDKPENILPLAGTDLSSGGQFEAEIFCREEMLILIRELKHCKRLQTDFLKALAQVLCELFAVWHLNRQGNEDIDEAKLIPVHACLYDGVDAYFISYDGDKFRRHAISGPPPVKGLGGIEEYTEASLKVHHYTFALFLEGYFKTLQLYHERSVRRGSSGDVSTRGSHRTVSSSVPPPMRRAVDSDTTKGWHEALRLAYDSRAYFQRAHTIPSNEPAEKGLQLLFESLQSWPPVGSKKDPFQLLLPTTIESWTQCVVKSHQSKLTVDPDPDWKPAFPEAVSVTIKERRGVAVDKFWARLPSNFRPLFEPFMLSKDDSFATLETISAAPDAFREDLEKVASVIMVSKLLNEMAKSHQEGHWKI
ncbi:hypothetical protein DFH09DRAFT_98697 [Mycena vulgaris]|nr:hypothetical protein DFH09DRAFT_98697 [Mycena vulgaris]